MNQLFFFRAIDYYAEKGSNYWKLHLISFEENFEQDWKLSEIWRIPND